MKIRPVSMPGFVLACLPLLWGLHAAGASAEPYRPIDPSEIVETLPAARDPHLRDLRRLHRLLAHAPTVLPLALAAARGDIEHARAEGDPRFNGYAQAALAPWWNLADPPPEVRLLRATLEQSSHDFPRALADLDRLIALQPKNAQAILIRAVIRQVIGDYTDAGADCARLAGLATPFVTAICAGSVAAMTGHARATAAQLDLFIANPQGEDSADIYDWALTLRGELAERTGDLATARASFEKALGLGVRDAYLLGAYADCLLEQAEFLEVVNLLGSETRNDALLLRLAIAEQRLGRPLAQIHIADLGERFEAARRRGDTIHRREEARYRLELLDDPAGALDLATLNWQVQREPADARILAAAAWAAHAPQAAEPVLAWRRANRVEDRTLDRLAQDLNGRSAVAPSPTAG